MNDNEFNRAFKLNYAKEVIALAKSIFLHVETERVAGGVYSADELEILEFAKRIEELNRQEVFG